MDVIDAPADVWKEAPDALPRGVGWADADDLWDDIPPVRHSKYKTRGANELAPLMLERLIALATNPGDLVIDPFGGSGTTFYAAERLERRWLGSEIGDIEPAVQRLSDLAAGIDIRWERSRGAKGRRGASKEQLGLNEAREVLSGFLLTVMEKKDSNGGAALREAIDRRFQEAGGWTKKQTGDVDWTKCHRVNGTEVC